ncbi:uncharacterized protein WM277_004243 [Molossus nigricans]
MAEVVSKHMQIDSPSFSGFMNRGIGRKIGPYLWVLGVRNHLPQQSLSAFLKRGTLCPQGPCYQPWSQSLQSELTPAEDGRTLPAQPCGRTTQSTQTAMCSNGLIVEGQISKVMTYQQHQFLRNQLLPVFRKLLQQNDILLMQVLLKTWQSSVP